MLVEECAELIVAANKWRRQEPGAIDAAIEELADVEIMCDQMRLVLDERKIAAVKETKLRRLAERLGIET
jgi:hypothetical protein